MVSARFSHLRQGVKPFARTVLDWWLRLRGISLPDDFDFRDRLDLVVHGMEPDVLSACQRLLRDGMTVVDIGANVGMLSRHFAKGVGATGHVFAFEPDPENFRHLQVNTRRWKQIECVQSAVGDTVSILRLYRNERSGTANSLVNSENARDTVEVPCLTLDAFWEERGHPVFDLVKIDVEGAEPLVLRGMRAVVAAHPTLRLLLEFAPKNLLAGGFQPSDLWQEVVSAGFTIEALDGAGQSRVVSAICDVDPLLNRHGYVNLVCTKGA